MPNSYSEGRPNLNQGSGRPLFGCESIIGDLPRVSRWLPVRPNDLRRLRPAIRTQSVRGPKVGTR